MSFVYETSYTDRSENLDVVFIVAGGHKLVDQLHGGRTNRIGH